MEQAHFCGEFSFYRHFVPDMNEEQMKLVLVFPSFLKCIQTWHRNYLNV